MPIQIELRPRGSRYWAGEEIELSLAIRNTGETPVCVPDASYLANGSPLYWLSGPSYPAGVYFNLAGMATGEGGAPPIAVGLHIPPEGDAVFRVRLGTMLPVTQPGFYDLKARVTCDGTMVESEAIRFELLQPSGLSVSISTEEGNHAVDEVPAAWAIRSRTGAVMVRRLHHAPEDGEVLENGVTDRVAEVSATASGPYSAAVAKGVRNRGWVAWFDGAHLYTHATGHAAPHAVVFASPVAAVATPVTLANGGVELFAVSATAALCLLQFPAPGDGASPSAVWSAQLPAQPQALAAVGRRAAYTYECDGGVAVRHVTLESGGAKAAEGSAFLPGVRLIGSSVPHIRVCAEGFTHVSLLVWRRGVNGPELSMAALTFNANGLLHAGPDSSLRFVAVLPAEPLEAAIDYRAAGLRRGLDWVLLLRNGQLLRGPLAQPVPARRSTPLRPLQLRAMEYVSLLGVQGATGEPGIQYV
ncbi:MAG: hypothetical protein JNM66_23800 [Bryobacterales bacterium]|nr:hypothetical protein [Bryobacterales bacterium]